MNFKHFLIFTCVSIVAFYILNENAVPMEKDRLQAEIEKLSLIEEIPNDFEAEIAFLKDSCSTNQLNVLINHPTPIIRAFTYLAILERKDIRFFPILFNKLNDTTQLMWWYFDDAGRTTTLADFFISNSINRLDSIEKVLLSHSIITQHQNLQYFNWVLEDIEPQEKYYSLIKKHARKQQESCNQERIIYALSKFKKESDLPFIKKLISSSECDYLLFNIIENWPDERYFDILQHHFDTTILHKKQFGYNDIEEFSYVVACYKNEKSLAILEQLIQNSTYKEVYYEEWNKTFVFKAIRYYHCKLYNKLYNQLKKEIDPAIVNDTDLKFERYKPNPWK